MPEIGTEPKEPALAYFLRRITHRVFYWLACRQDRNR